MTSEKQLEANRRNALKSTGPKTTEGKAVVSMNSLTHGLRARRAVLRGENEEDFRQLCADLEAAWQPQNRTEQLLLEEMAMSQWKLVRMETIEDQIMLKSTVNKEAMGLLAQLFQQQVRLKNSFHKSMSALERLQKTRPASQDRPAEAAPETAAAAIPLPMAATAGAAAPSELAESPDRRVAAP